MTPRRDTARAEHHLALARFASTPSGTSRHALRLCQIIADEGLRLTGDEDAPLARVAKLVALAVDQRHEPEGQLAARLVVELIDQHDMRLTARRAPTPRPTPTPPSDTPTRAASTAPVRVIERAYIEVRVGAHRWERIEWDRNGWAWHAACERASELQRTTGQDHRVVTAPPTKHGRIWRPQER